LLLKLLRVPSIVFAINKLDAVDQPQLAYEHIVGSLRRFAQAAGINVTAWVPVSALKGWNVVQAQAGWCGYEGPSLLSLLEALPVTPTEADAPLSFPVQWVEKCHDARVTSQGRRVFWGRVATGLVAVGQAIKVFPSGQSAVVAQVLSATRQAHTVDAGQSAGVVLDREVDVSRGDWLWSDVGAPEPQTVLNTTVAWMDDEPLVAGRVYWALHGHRWVKAKVQRVVHRLDINTLAEEDATELPANAIGHVTLALQQPLLTLPFERSRSLGALILVDTATHRTSGAVLVQAP
jgi:sulfate adenylyltransferase subunit 1